MSHGEGGFVEGPAEQNGRRGGHTAGRRVGKGGVSWWTFRSPQKCKKKCLQHLEHLATSDMLKMAFGGNGSRRELQSNSEAEEGWLARGKKGQGLGLATGSMEKTENEVTGNFQSRLRLRRGEPLVSVTVQRKKGSKSRVSRRLCSK